MAVIFVVPTAFAVTFPLSSTEAMLSFSEVHVRALLSVVFSGSISASNETCSFFLSVTSVSDKVIFVIVIGSTTVTLHVFVLPFSIDAIISTSPTETPFTSPSLSTVAILLSDDSHVIFSSLNPFNCNCPSLGIDASFLLIPKVPFIITSASAASDKVIPFL